MDQASHQPSGCSAATCQGGLIMSVIRELITVLRFESKGLREAQARMNQLQGAARALVATIASVGIAISARNFVEAGDRLTQSLNKLSGALGGPEEAARIYEQIYSSAKDTGIAVEGTVQQFGNYNLAMKKAGRSADETVQLVTGLQAGMVSLGVAGAQAASVTLQLGQALGSNKLGGEELHTLKEAMPQLVEFLRTRLKLTDEQFKKESEGGKLTSARLIGPLMEFAAQSKEAMKNMVPTLQLATGKMRVVWERFQADMDKALGLSQYMARNLTALSTWVEGLRRFAPAVREFVSEVGGMDAIFRVLSIGLGVATAGFVAMNSALLATLVRFLAIPAAIAAIAIALDDLSVWARGGDSSIGRRLGSFESAMGGMKNALGPFGDAVDIVRDAFSSTSGLVPKTLAEFKQFAEWGKAGADLIRENWPGIGSIFTGLFRDVAPALGGMNRDFEALKKLLVDAPGLITAAWAGIVGFFTDIFERLGTAFDKAWERVSKVAEAIKGAAKALTTPQGDPDKPSLNGAPIPLFPAPGTLLRSPASYGETLIPRMGMQAAGFNSANVNSTVSNSIVVNATGISGAEVSAATQNGVGRAMDRSAPGEALARALGVASPRVEAAAA